METPDEIIDQLKPPHREAEFKLDIPEKPAPTPDEIMERFGLGKKKEAQFKLDIPEKQVPTPDEVAREEGLIE